MVARKRMDGARGVRLLPPGFEIGGSHAGILQATENRNGTVEGRFGRILICIAHGKVRAQNGEHELHKLRVLQDFEPTNLHTGGFDSRWGMLGRVRLLRGAAYERLGRRAEAREEYQQVLAQWKSADAELQPFVDQARRGLARMGVAS